MNAQSGSALLEVVIATAILAGVLATVLLVQQTTSGALRDTTTGIGLQDKATRAMEVLASELRWGNTDTLLITTENGSSRIDLQKPVGFTAGATIWSSTIVYRVEPSTVDADRNGVIDEGRLVRIQDGNTRILCDYVTAGGFSAAATTDNVQLQLRLARRDTAASSLMTADATTSISLRN